MPLGNEGEIPLQETNLAGLLDVGQCKQTSQNYIKMSFLQDIIVSNDGKNYTLVVSWGFPLKSVEKPVKSQILGRVSVECDVKYICRAWDLLDSWKFCCRKCWYS